MVFTNVFSSLIDAAGRTERYVSSCGGTRSGKTYSMLQLLYLIVASDTTPTINSVVSQTYPHLERGAIRDFKDVVGEDFHSEWWSESKHTYTFPSGAIIEFFSVDKPERVHGPSRDRLFVNEAQTIKYDTITQLLTRTRGLVFFDYNPTHEFWLNTEIEPLPECVTIHSTYLDNKDRETGTPMLSSWQIREIENRRKSASWWRVYGEGKRGVLDGLIYPDFEQIDALPDNSDGHLSQVYGMDFGFNDPTTLVDCLVDVKRRVVYIDLLLYERQLRNRQIAERLNALGIRKNARIFGDCVAATSINEVNFEGGYNVKACNKSKEVVEQIQFVQGFALKVTKRSVEMIREFNNYQWLKDSDGKTLNVPDKDAHQDHALDAMRYALFSAFGTFRKPLSGGIAKTGNVW